jgi:nicotinate-nucleotide adenylyltransferase
MALLGGSFDPVHNGHLVIARDLKEALGVDRMILVPAAQSPFKSAGPQASAKQRLAMLRLAVRGEPGLEVSDVELRRSGTSYTIDTVRTFRNKYPGTRLVWVVGSDNLKGLPQWREARALLEECELWVAARGGIEHAKALKILASLPVFFRRALRDRLLKNRQLDISSTEIRARAQRGESNKGLVPDAVASYITRHRPYD